MLVIKYHHYLFIRGEGPGGSMSKVVGLRNNSCKPITNTALKITKRVHSTRNRK